MNDYTPYTPPSARTDTEAVAQAATYTPFILLAVIALVAYLTGIGDILMKGSRYYTIYYLGTMIVYAVLGVSWYHADAARLGRPCSKLMDIAIVMVLALSIPVYLFRSRGLTKGALATILFILFLVSCVALNGLGEMTIVGFNSVLMS